jgi:hypothetical protein
VSSNAHVHIREKVDSVGLPRPWLWTAAVLLVGAPLVALLCLVVWRTPFPISEAVAIFEDVENYPPSRFITPDTAYYRPLFHLTISAIWHGAGSLEAMLSAVRLLHIVPILLLTLLLIAWLRPRTPLDAAAAVLALCVLIGSPGFRDNLELPLSYTIVGMPLAVIVWLLATRERRWWHEPTIVLATLLAIGFKEQGLVLVPLVVATWWTRAPGVRGRGAAILVGVAAVYVGVRLAARESWPAFEQAVGLGFGEMEPPEAAARYGSAPYLQLLYAYSGASTVANVLFSEPTRGTFTTVRALVDGYAQPWQLVHVASSALLTTLIAWWGWQALKDARRDGWSPDARLCLALIVVLLASGALSFNYSRDRLGGMAVPFYAMAAYHAVRAAAARIVHVRRLAFIVAAAGLFLLSAGWGVRAIGTIERTRLNAERNHLEWLVLIPERRLEFKDRQTYLRIMDAMRPEGAGTDGPRPTRYPRSMARWIGES